MFFKKVATVSHQQSVLLFQVGMNKLAANFFHTKIYIGVVTCYYNLTIIFYIIWLKLEIFYCKYIINKDPTGSWASCSDT